MLGVSVGNYTLVKLLGEGGMGSVYRAVQPEIGAEVAIKVLHATPQSHAGAVQRFMLEAQAVNRVRHRGLIRILDTGFLADRRPYLVMEFLDGISLADAVGRMPPQLACFAACEALVALDAVHEHGVVHRDLKPANLFLARDGRVVVLDFGIAKLVDPDGLAQTHSTGLIGTPEYMAPEQIRSQPLDRRTDVYAMGIVLYETITGHRPFAAAATFDMLVQHLERPPTAPRERVPELAPAIDAAIVRALAKDPAARFQSAAELAATLRAAIGPDSGRAALAAYVDARAPAPPVPLEATPPSQHPERVKPEIAAREVETMYAKPAKRRRWIPIAGITVVVLSGGSAYLAARSRLHHAVTANPDAAIVTATPADAAIVVPAPPDAALAAATSPLRVDTDPEGADVTIDGTLAGKSPVVVTLVTGTHRLSITRAGWKPYEGPVYVPANERPATRISLTRAPIAPTPRDRVDPPVETSQPAPVPPVPPPTEKPNPYR
jgi:serine/threonine-protein kinase